PRRAAPKGMSNGPSCARRTSSIEPNSVPSASTTGAWSSSLRRMAAPGDVGHHVVAEPSLAGRGADVVAVGPQGHVVADVLHKVERDAHRVALAQRHDRVDPSHPVTEGIASEAVRQRARPRQDGGDVKPARLLAPRELEVVDDARHPPVAVDELAIEQVQPGPQPTRIHQAPPLGMIMSGMVPGAMTTRTTR